MENTDFPLNFVIFVLQNPGFNKWKASYTSVFEVEKRLRQMSLNFPDIVVNEFPIISV